MGVYDIRDIENVIPKEMEVVVNQKKPVVDTMVLWLVGLLQDD